MKETKQKKENKQIIEVHIYVHTLPPTNYPINPNGTGTPFSPWTPPYIVTC